MRIAVGSDHRGYQIKGKLVTLLRADGHEVTDFGTQSDQPVDYPDYAVSVAKFVAEGKAERGILICGTGFGMAIAANKFKGVRAATCADEVMAEMCRRHNDVNVLCLPGDLIGDRPVGDLVRVWLATEFEGGRHSRRVEKINHIEQENLAS
ncbi:MAG: ribose 5-phosphate isomerase B [Planctomycetota bacterium]|jgi:ribose 5-phosphate isomerase B